MSALLYIAECTIYMFFSNTMSIFQAQSLRRKYCIDVHHLHLVPEPGRESNGVALPRVLPEGNVDLPVVLCVTNRGF